MMNIFRCMMKPVDLQLQGRLFFDLFLFAPCHQTGCELGAWFGFFAFWVLFCSKILHSGIIAATLDAKKERFLLHPTFDLFLQVGGVWSDDIVIFWQFETHSWSGKRLQKSTTSCSLSSLSMRWAFFVKFFCINLTRPDWLKLILLQQLFWAWLELYRRQFSSYSHFSSFRASRRSFLRPQCSLSWLSGRNRKRDFPSILNQMLCCLFQPGYIFSSEVPNDHPELSRVLHNDQVYKQGTHCLILK